MFSDWLFLGQSTRGTQTPQAPAVATPQVAIPAAMPSVEVLAAATPIVPTATQPAAEPAVPATAVPVPPEAKVAAMPALPAASLLAKIPKFSP